MTGECRALCGPIWKLGGETCQCVEPAGHAVGADAEPGSGHRCSCGTWFDDSVARHPTEPAR